MDTIDKIWIYIKPYIFVSQLYAKDKMLLYNTQNGDFLETQTSISINLINALHEKANLGTTLVKHTILKEPIIGSFIEEAITKDILGVLPYSSKTIRPIQLMPVLNIQKNIKTMQDRNDKSIGENILNYLKELNLFVNSQCDKNCDFCNNAYRQFLCCTKSQESNEMDHSTLLKIARQIEHSPLDQINILGGNIFTYSFLKDIGDIFRNHTQKIHYWFYYKNYSSLPFQGNADILVDFPLKIPSLTKCLHQLPEDTTNYHFIIQNEKELDFINNEISSLNIKNITVNPLFTKNNLPFFEEKVFLERRDIFVTPISQRQIFCNQALNSNHFGSLFILTNGNMLANINTPVLGNIQQTNILYFIQKELEENTAWMKTRITTPCTQCLYQFLCPPISNYEYVMKKNNLCTIK